MPKKLTASQPIAASQVEAAARASGSPAAERQGDISAIHATYINSLLVAEQRRSQVSTIYTSLLTAGIGGIGFKPDVDLLFPAIASLILCTLWVAKVRYFQALATVKWQTALRLEQRLIASPFSDEYQLIKQARKEKRYSRRRFADMERILPYLIGVLSALYIGHRLLAPLLP